MDANAHVGANDKVILTYFERHFWNAHNDAPTISYADDAMGDIGDHSILDIALASYTQVSEILNGSSSGITPSSDTLSPTAKGLLYTDYQANLDGSTYVAEFLVLRIVI